MAGHRAVSFEWDDHTTLLTVRIDSRESVASWLPVGDAAWIGAGADGRRLVAEASGASFDRACAVMMDAAGGGEDDLSSALRRLLG